MTDSTQPTPDGQRTDLSAGYTPETRAVLEDQGIKLFEIVAEVGSLPTTDPRIREGGKYAEALQVLVRLGLLRHPPEDPTTWIPVDPTAVQAQVVTPMSLEGTRLIQESARWTAGFTALRSSWRRAAPTDERGPFTYVHGPGIAPFIASLLAECDTEVLTAQPQDRRDTEGLGEAIRGELAALERGVKLRTLYQHAARRNIATREYVAAITPHGGEVRTLDEFFNRMLIFDRRIAIIPHSDNLSVAVAVREPAIVAYLTDVFERAWERARPFHLADPGTVKDIAKEQRAMTLRMLLGGHSDPSASKRLGVSPRTYAGYVADLKEEFDADTRFQLGYMIGREGVVLPDSEQSASRAGDDAE